MKLHNHPLAELLSFLEALSDPYVVFDRQYRILAANPAYRQRSGIDIIVGRCCYEVSHRYPVPCDQAGESCPLSQSLKSGQRERVLHLHHTPRGEEYVDIELTPIHDASGEITCFVEKMVGINQAKGLPSGQGLIGRAPAFQRMLSLVARVAPSEAVVLLEGESGTGKELVANALHQASRRATAPFIAVDCSGIPDTLFESELFGHERGAFTGAVARKPGLVEAASGGTLFLDEVGEIPPTMQVKLLRLLETGTYRRVGSAELRRADVRIVSATHRSLSSMVDAGTFRADLFYRLNIFAIRVPPLRERLSDIPLLTESLLVRVAPGRALELTPAALDLLMDLPYRGNVRELRNLLERASLMSDGDSIDVDHFVETATAEQSVGLSCKAEIFAGADSLSFAEALAVHRGPMRELAVKLGISERTLYRRLRDLRRDLPSIV
jgi:DNA-binding NtrC family response regulator